MSWNWSFFLFVFFWSTVELHVNNNSKTKLKLVVRVSWCQIRDAEEKRQDKRTTAFRFSHTKHIWGQQHSWPSFGGASSRSRRFTTTPATRAWSFASTSVFEDNSSSVAMWLCHSCHLEQQLTCHLFTTNCTPDATENQRERERYKTPSWDQGYLLVTLANVTNQWGRAPGWQAIWEQSWSKFRLFKVMWQVV